MTLLIDYNILSINFLLRKLLINPKIILQSQLELEVNHHGSELLYSIVKKVGGSTYLSGRGAVESTSQGEPYLEVDKFKEIRVDVLDYDPPHKFSALHHLIVSGDFE